MVSRSGFLQFLVTATIVVLGATLAAAQNASPIRMDSFPVGLKPLGIDIAFHSQQAVVANSGENSISILRLGTGKGRPAETIRGIPSPYAVATCPNPEIALVTSPADNSVTVVPFGDDDSPRTGDNLRTIKVGPQPHAVGCLYDGVGFEEGVVSNVGDNSLTVFDPGRGKITETIPDVPGSRDLHGIVFSFTVDIPPHILAWVASSDANVVTVVDLVSSQVRARIPVSRPTAIRNGGGNTVVVASAGDNNITTYNAGTLAVISITPNVSNPQDLVFGTKLGTFATTGGQNAVWRQAPGGEITIINGIPGAASLAAYTDPHPVGGAGSIVVVTSPDSNSVFLIQQRQPEDTPTPHDFGLANAASFATTQASPGTLVSTFASTGVSKIFYAESLPLPTTLGGVTLRIGGTWNLSAASVWTYSSTGSILAALLAVGPNQINFQIPPGIAPGSTIPAQLTRPDGSTLLATFNIAPAAPGIFTMLQNGQGQGTVQNQDYSQNGSSQSIGRAQPAERGSVIRIYSTGGGETTPSLLPGEPAPASGIPLVTTNIQPTVTIGGVTAQVLFSGIAPGYAGLWQINAVVPQNVTAGNAVPLTVTSGGVASNTVTIAVK